MIIQGPDKLVIFVKFKSINVLLEVKGLLNKKSSAFFFPVAVSGMRQSYKAEHCFHS